MFFLALKRDKKPNGYFKNPEKPNGFFGNRKKPIMIMIMVMVMIIIIIIIYRGALGNPARLYTCHKKHRLDPQRRKNQGFFVQFAIFFAFFFRKYQKIKICSY